MKPNLKLLMLITLQIVLILVPLTWTASTSELFEFPKMLLTYAGAIVIAAFWGARMFQERRFIFRRTPFELPILLFLASQAISAILSIHPHTSLFGYYSRFNGGLFSLIAYSVIYFAAVSNFDLKDAKTILRTLVITAVLSSLYAFPEHFGHSPSCLLISGKFHASCWVQDVQTRIFGTFGQPNWLAAYLIVILPLTIFSTVYAKVRNSRLVYLASTILILLTILFTKSQSGIGAAIVAAALSFTIIVIQKKKAILLLGFIPLVAIVLIMKQSAVTRTIASLNMINPFNSSAEAIVSKENQTRIGGSDSMAIRRIVWEGAWELASRHPLFGTGAETFAYSYYNVRPAIHNLVSEWDFLYNKAHNEFLNYAATTGFIGLGTYLLFLGSFIIFGLKHSHPQATALSTGFVVLCISNFFGFSTVPVNTLLFLIPALVYLLTTKESLPVSKIPGHPVPWLGYSLISLITVFLLSRVYVTYKADRLYASGKSARESQNYQSAILNLQEAFRLLPDQALYADELSLAASEVATSLHQTGKVAEASQAATIAVALSNQAIQLNPVHLNFYKTRTRVFINLSAIDPGYGVEAGVALDQAIRLAPTDAKLWYNRALLTHQLGFTEESLGIFEKTLELKPDYTQARTQYNQILEQNN